MDGLLEKEATEKDEREQIAREKLALWQAEEETRQAEEKARQSEEKARQAEREEVEEVARQENDPHFLATLDRAKQSEKFYPDTAARYYRDIAEIYPKTALAKEAAIKAKELWAQAYGNNDGPPRLGTCAKAGCNNRVPEGEKYCSLDDDRTSNYSGSYPIHIGPGGGVYHYSKIGKKVYHKR